MKQMIKDTVKAIAHLIEEADKQNVLIPEYKNNIATVVVSSNGEIASPMDLAVFGENADALRLITILSNSTSGFYQTNELDNASRDIAKEIFGERVRRVVIWSRLQAGNAVIQIIDAKTFEDGVDRTRRLFNLINELYDNDGFIVTGIY